MAIHLSTIIIKMHNVKMIALLLLIKIILSLMAEKILVVEVGGQVSVAIIIGSIPDHLKY